MQLSLALSSDISQINQLLKCQRKNQSFNKELQGKTQCDNLFSVPSKMAEM